MSLFLLLFQSMENVPLVQERKDGSVVTALTWDLGDLHSVPRSATDSLCDYGQVT